MKPSLEDERRALLEQIEASRSLYRKMLAGDIDNSAMRTSSNTPGTTVSHRGQSIRVLSRSLTVRWVMDHPFAVAAGVAVLVWAVPSLWNVRSRSKV